MSQNTSWINERRGGPPEFVDYEHNLTGMGKTLKGAENEIKYMAKFVAEFLGTFVLVFTVAYVSFYHNTLIGCTAIGFVLMVMVYAMGPVSGGHLNPAVTITLHLLGKSTLTFFEFLGYIIFQIGAGLTAGGVVHLMMEKPLNFGPAEPYIWWQAGLIEVFYTFMLCFIVANVAASKGNNPEGDGNCFYGLAIGFVVIAGAYGGGAISGGVFNPAVALGINIPFKTDLWCLWYSIFEVVGALMAVLFYKICRSQEQDYELEADPSLWRQGICEFLGAFMLVLTVGLNVSVGSAAGAWSISAALMCMIYALGDISGGHFNPSVTIAILLAGKDPDQKTDSTKTHYRVVVYILMQLLGGMLAGVVFMLIHCSVHSKLKILGTGPVDHYSWQQAAFAEFFFTFVLAFTVLSVAVYTPKEESQFDAQLVDWRLREKEKPPWKTKHRNHAALAIGLCVMCGGGAIGSVSGGHLNPAVSFGMSSGASWIGYSHAVFRWSNCLLYSLLQLGGGAMAAGVYFATHPDDYRF
jgi:aquaporin Z